jgi:REP-associated tyrosine transposase
VLGTIRGAESLLSRFGEAVRVSWQELPDFYSDIQLDEMVIMSNHLHGIIVLAPTSHLRKTTLSRVVRTLKSRSARRINEIRGVLGVPVWQRGYYERVIRDDDEMKNVREYIRNNPLRWWLQRNDASDGRVGDPPLRC